MQCEYCKKKKKNLLYLIYLSCYLSLKFLLCVSYILCYYIFFAKFLDDIWLSFEFHIMICMKLNYVKIMLLMLCHSILCNCVLTYYEISCIKF